MEYEQHDEFREPGGGFDEHSDHDELPEELDFDDPSFGGEFDDEYEHESSSDY
jgi:hypothetical protein